MLVLTASFQTRCGWLIFTLSAPCGATVIAPVLAARKHGKNSRGVNRLISIFPESAVVHRHPILMAGDYPLPIRAGDRKHGDAPFPSRQGLGEEW